MEASRSLSTLDMPILLVGIRVGPLLIYVVRHDYGNGDDPLDEITRFLVFLGCRAILGIGAKKSGIPKMRCARIL